MDGSDGVFGSTDLFIFTGALALIIGLDIFAVAYSSHRNAFVMSQAAVNRIAVALFDDSENSHYDEESSVGFAVLSISNDA